MVTGKPDGAIDPRHQQGSIHKAAVVADNQNGSILGHSIGIMHVHACS
jgi:hypothetical protein